MSLLDILLIGALVAVAAWWLFAAQTAKRWLRLAPIALGALALIQFMVEGFYWQFVAGWLLIVVFALLSIFSRGAPAGVVGLLGRIALGGLALAALGPFMLMLPAPWLTRPDGPYAVGSEIFRWVDASRGETATDDPADKRNVIAQAWYPAAPGAHGQHSVYIDGLRDLPPTVSVMPGFLMRSFGAIDTHAVTGAPIATEQARWPVVILSPGFGAPRAVYSGLAAGLASRGYVVFTLDHPYESGVTELADGRIVTDANTMSKHSDSEATQFDWMAEEQSIRAADVGFLLDQLGSALGPNLSGHLDLDHIAAIGHSFGGAASVAAMERDPRIKAAANIDGTLYGDVASHALDRPFLLLESDHVETGHGEPFLKGNQTLLDNLAGPGWRYEIAHANHYSFTDAPLFLAPPGRFALSLLIGGGRGPEATQRIAIDILDAFLSGPLGRPARDVDTAAKTYQGVKGGKAH